MATIKTTQEMFMHELGDIYSAEEQFLKGQEEMLQNATDPTLRQMIEQHIRESQHHMQNLDQIFQMMGKQEKVKCQGAAGICAEAKQNMKEAGTNAIRDALIAGAAERVEHYEIASYTGLVEGARLMGQQQAMQLLQQNLQQEEEMAQRIKQGSPQLMRTAMEQEGMQPGQMSQQTEKQTM